MQHATWALLEPQCGEAIQPWSTMSSRKVYLKHRRSRTIYRWIYVHAVRMVLHKYALYIHCPRIDHGGLTRKCTVLIPSRSPHWRMPTASSRSNNCGSFTGTDQHPDNLKYSSSPFLIGNHPNGWSSDRNSRIDRQSIQSPLISRASTWHPKLGRSS